MATSTPLGIHFLIELYEASPELLDDLEFVKKTLIEAAAIGQVTVVSEALHRFSPQGVSGVLVIAESHLSVHTWPEKGYAALDLFTCGDSQFLAPMAQFLARQFGAKQMTEVLIRRGLLEKREVDIEESSILVGQ